MISKLSNNFLLCTLILLANLALSCNSQAINCGVNWSLYKDQKCIKLIDTLVTYENAEAACIAEIGDPQSSIPPLLTVNSKEEQDFLTQFLFDDSAVLENVWLGAGRVNETQNFQWSDGSPFSYTNWRMGYPSSIVGDDCVQMTPINIKGELKSNQPVAAGDGFWMDVSCLKRNLIVCQKAASWTLLDLQKALFDLRDNPVPIGFVYVQLPGQADAMATWPTVTWQEVTLDYAGLFFRAEGGESGRFGDIQNDQTRRITNVDASDSGTTGHPRSITLAEGSCSVFMFAGYAYGHDYDDTMRFCTNSVEVRPKNTAVRIWKRIN